MLGTKKVTGMKNNEKFYRDPNEDSLIVQGLKTHLGLIFIRVPPSCLPHWFTFLQKLP